MLATDEQGRTVARWNVALFPPISTPIQTLELTMRTERAAVPGAEVLLTPAGTDQDPATGFADELLDGSTSGSEELYEGLSTLDAAAGEIAQGTDELATGLAALAEGATAASGASETLAQGVGGLADGAEAAADASDTLAQGVGGLAAGAEAAADASDTLAQGVGGLAAGADDVAAGSAELAWALGQAAAGAQDLARATAALASATSGNPQDQLQPLITGGAQIEAGLLEAAARIGSPGDPVLDLITPLPPDGDNTCPPGGTAPPDDDCVTIYQGVRALRDGLAAVDAVAAALEGRVDAAREAIVATLEGLGSISDDVRAAANGAAELYASVCLAPDPTLDADSCAQLLAVAEAAESALATAGETVPDITDLVAALAILEKQAAALSAALDVALASTERLLLGVEAVALAVGTGTPNQPGLATAMSALNAGLGELAAELARSQQELTTAVSAVAAGSAELATGIDGAATGADDLSDGSELLAEGAKDAASGADDLSDGSELLAEGAKDAASGAGDLAEGSEQLAQGAKDAASGAGALAEGSEQLAQGAQEATQGADQLSRGLTGLATGTDGAAVAGGYLAEGAQALQDGTGPAAEGVLDASISPALAQAWLEATAERAAEALPYGPPVGAQGNVAYVFSLAEVPAPRSFWERIRGMFGG
jgi:putative membrane protein